MARSARLVVPGMPHHVYQRGNNGQAVFGDDADYDFYLDRLKEASRQYRTDIHGYALLPNCIHLLATPPAEEALSRMMQWMGRCYVPYFNKKYRRSGTLWDSRFKTSVMEAASLILCCRFIESVPVSNGLADRPEDYVWSSCRHHVGINPSPFIRDHAVYWDLGNTPFAREMAYKEFSPWPENQDAPLQEALLKGWPVGSNAFIRRLEADTGRQFRMGRRGRPEKTKTE